MKRVPFILIGLTLNMYADFTRNNNTEVVKDNQTGLYWQDNLKDASSMNWVDAINYCKTLKLANFDNWRLPTLHELSLIVNPNTEQPPTIYATFQNIESDTYWTSDNRKKAPAINSKNIKETISFYKGEFGNAPTFEKYYVRCVSGTEKL